MCCLVRKNHPVLATHKRTRRVIMLHDEIFALLIILISSSLITLVICSSSSRKSNNQEPQQLLKDQQETEIDHFKIRVLHTNDLHSRFDEVTISGSKCKVKDKKKKSCYGGVARIKYMVDQIRNQQKPDENVLFLNAGDFFQVKFNKIHIFESSGTRYFLMYIYVYSENDFHS